MDSGIADVPLEIRTRRLVLRCPGETDGATVYASVREPLDEPDGSLRDVRVYASIR